MSEKTLLRGKSAENEKQKFLGQTYGWMALALFISGVSAYIGASYTPLMNFIWGNHSIGFIVLSITELVLVIVFSATMKKMSVGTAVVCFIAYSIINGLTLSSIFWVYSISSISYCFISCSAMFFVMCIYGMKTKTNLAPFAKYLIMGLIGIIVVSAANVLVSLITKTQSTVIDWIISLVSVVLFTGLTAYDSQKILKASFYAENSDSFKKLAIYGALELYLDFINLFLSLLRFFGKKE